MGGVLISNVPIMAIWDYEIVAMRNSLAEKQARAVSTDSILSLSIFLSIYPSIYLSNQRTND